jgi:methylenetetrahydrofolate dehydrogenase (NADP+) / methenyltetrahydrofolate cyclohydrolase
MEIIDGRKMRDGVLENIKSDVALLSFQPIFCDVLVGEDPASIQYVRMKARTAESVGIHFHNASYQSTITTSELIAEIKKLNEMKNMCGIIVQLPLPDTIDKQAVLDAIDPALDVDCLGTTASDIFYSGNILLGFPTALACMVLLDSLNLDLTDKKIVVQGQGLLVGKPVAALLRFRGIDPIIITSKTENKLELLKEADVIISGIGKGKYVTGDMVKENVVLIDAGTSESTGAIVGDVDLESVRDKASFVSPVPGGVGPVTVAMLLGNVLKVAQTNNNDFS